MSKVMLRADSILNEVATASGLDPAVGTVPTAGEVLGSIQGVGSICAAARVAVLMAADLVTVSVGCAGAYLIWAHAVLHQPVGAYLAVIPLLMAFPLVYAAMGLYPGFGIGAVESVRRLSHGTSLGFLLLAAATFTFKFDSAYSRVTFAVAWATCVVLVPSVRFAVVSLAGRLQWWGRPTIIIGSHDQAELAIRLLSASKSLGYHVVGVLTSEHQWRGRTIDGVRVVGPISAAPQVAVSGIATAIVFSDGENPARLHRLQRCFRHVVWIRGEDGLPVEHVQVRNLGTVFGVEFTNELLRPENRVLKRALDIVLGSIFLVLAAPLISLGALAVKLVSPGSAFFCQEREGLDGRRLKIWKLRTMRPDAEQRLAKFLAADPELRREWDQRMKLRRDPRVIPVVGTFLRRFSLDELPQLLSVVGGRLSLVGPRPFPAYHLDRFPSEFRELRTSVRPGLTGMWQVAIRSSGGIKEQMRYDTYYIRNWSPWLDFYLLARTICAVFAARGAC